MNALFVGFNRSYTNPTAETQLRVIGSITNLDFFGPGFVNNQDLLKGIEAWADKKKYDIILTDSYVFEYDNIICREKPFAGDFLRFKPEYYYEYVKEYFDFFQNSKINKILIGNWDTFGINKILIDRIHQSNTLVIDPGFTLQESKEKILVKYGEPCYGNDNWFDFTNQYKEKVIAIPHTISSIEFDFSPLMNRNHRFSVIGAPYPERKKASELMENYQKIKQFNKRVKSWILFKRIKSFSEKELTLLRLDYMRECSDSIFCYCSGGPWLYPVRKYFEIPARGAVAIGWPCNGFENLGFVDGYNFISAINNRMIKEVISDFNIEDVQSIATNGRSLIWEKHSDWARAIQLSESFQLILQDKFNGSYWKNGLYMHY
jgi:hypothetical protein